MGSAGAVSWGGEPPFGGIHALTMSKMTTPSAGGLVRTISLRRFERSRQTRFDIVLSLSVGLTRPLGSSPGRTLGSVAAVLGAATRKLKADLDFARCSAIRSIRFRGSNCRTGETDRQLCRSSEVPGSGSSSEAMPGQISPGPFEVEPARAPRLAAAPERTRAVAPQLRGRRSERSAT